jgi:metallophosphoesterase superfamily enzyme
MGDKRYIFFDKTLFFPKEKILVIGDLHFGFDYLLKKAGIPIYKKQIDETKIELIKIFENLNKQGFQIKK